MERGIGGRLNSLASNDSLCASTTLLVQGEGVQLGMGDDVVEAPKTKVNPLVDAIVKNGRRAAGEYDIVGIAAGAMFSMIADSTGQVRHFLLPLAHSGSEL